MKLRNKKTGEILNEVRSSMTYKDNIRLYDETSDKYYSYNSLAELNEEWEDYEEPEDVWYIDWKGDVRVADGITNDWSKEKEIGNYFESKEEAEKAVEKLKAWKRLKDECNIKFDGIIRDNKAMLKGVKLSYDRHTVTFDRMRECMDALHLLFGGEE